MLQLEAFEEGDLQAAALLLEEELSIVHKVSGCLSMLAAGCACHSLGMVIDARVCALCVWPSGLPNQRARWADWEAANTTVYWSCSC